MTENEKEPIRMRLLSKLDDGVTLDNQRQKLLLTGRETKLWKRETRFLSWAEKAHPNRARLKNPKSGKKDYPSAPPPVGTRVR